MCSPSEKGSTVTAALLVAHKSSLIFLLQLPRCAHPWCLQCLLSRSHPAEPCVMTRSYCVSLPVSMCHVGIAPSCFLGFSLVFLFSVGCCHSLILGVPQLEKGSKYLSQNRKDSSWAARPSHLYSGILCYSNNESLVLPSLSCFWRLESSPLQLLILKTSLPFAVPFGPFLPSSYKMEI